jgi:hypothetical protein
MLGSLVNRPALWRLVAGFGMGAALALAAGSAASAGDKGKRIAAGEHAPDVELPATQADKALPDQKDARTLHLKDLEGKKNVVLYFFPKALTGG